MLQYTLKAFLETMPYVEVDVSEQRRERATHGVRHVEVTPEQAGQRLDNFIHGLLADLPRSRIYRVIRKGEVRVNGHRAAPDTRLQAHDKIRIPPVRLQPPRDPGQPPVPLLERLRKAIIHEDPELLVIDKPA